jgi:phosphocarrier protein HPr
MTSQPPSSTTGSSGGAPLRKVMMIRNKRGLHARASAKFVKCAEQFDAQMTVSRDGMSVSASSIMGLMMLAAHPGSQIALEVSGPEAEAALIAIVTLIEAKFDED